jgi:CRISPR-associated protein (TIGR03984 family)
MKKLTPVPDPAGCCEPINLDARTLTDNLTGWLVANGAGCHYLLAHTERGVVWGRIDKDRLYTSHDAFPDSCQADLNIGTLWQVRLFGPHVEFLLWCTDSIWRARRFTEPTVKLPSIDEPQMLWGTSGTHNTRYGFTLLQDGAEGLRHAVPLLTPDDAFVSLAGTQQPQRPVRLLVRPYLSYTTAGVAYIAMSRLVGLLPDPAKEDSNVAA